MKFKAMRFFIGDNPAVSKAIQKRLFKLGYKWAKSGKKVSHTEKRGLTTWDDGDITHGSGNQAAGFTDVDVEWMKPVEERELLEVGDKTYYLDDVEASLAEVEEAKTN